MKAAVVRFPGSNCDQDCYFVLREVFGVDTEYVWHQENSVADFDVIILPGGFSYGDYLRCGAIARFSPVMRSLIEEAERGKLIVGICNGFQILCEAGLLPGALIRNKTLHFICRQATLRVEYIGTPFTNACWTGTLLRIPVAHGEGNYVADPVQLREMNLKRQILLRYVDELGSVNEAASPNGSMQNIAGICNERGNVFGLMPHPERACDPLLGSEDGRLIFESIFSALKSRKAA
jgi:phosphoribosylformylglycinamidine synthase I